MTSRTGVSFSGGRSSWLSPTVIQVFQSLCALPLTTVHRRIGSIGVASKRENAYSKEEVRFLSLVADQVALAIDDALNLEASQAAQAKLPAKAGAVR